MNTENLPHEIYSGTWKTGHVQGIAIDTEREYIYYSFTTTLVKTDLRGNLVGTVDGIVGHLGCLDFCDTDGCVYGSLEYKQDEIGRGILHALGSDAKLESAFYIARFDGKKITRPGMDAERDGIMTAVYLPEVVQDYLGAASDGTPHIHGCSGIDGTAFGPRFGERGGKLYLNVAYGVYSDINRRDNDYQVILTYDTADLDAYFHPLSQASPHHNGPDHPAYKYFVHTGNTTYGVQNLEYDAYTGNWFMAVYPGVKKEYPNYPFFIIDGSKAPVLAHLYGFAPEVTGETLTLLHDGLHDEASGVYGWDFPHGDTGLFALDDGYYYISHNGSTGDGLQYSRVFLYRWTGESPVPFERIP
ncbi:MAG: hypothetical protein VB111_03055 [Clostridiaceae bacterium]|nr:hypothetical protein [Clostridiaceae bacterium]